MNSKTWTSSTSKEAPTWQQRQQLSSRKPANNWSLYKGPTLLENPEKEVKARMLKFLNNLSVFTACQGCERKITEISHQNCEARQRQGKYKRYPLHI